MERIKSKRESARRGCCQTQVAFGEILPDVNHGTQEVIIHMKSRKHDLERRMFAHSIQRKGWERGMAAISQHMTGFN